MGRPLHGATPYQKLHALALGDTELAAQFGAAYETLAQKTGDDFREQLLASSDAFSKSLESQNVKLSVEIEEDFSGLGEIALENFRDIENFRLDALNESFEEARRQAELFDNQMRQAAQSAVRFGGQVIGAFGDAATARRRFTENDVALRKADYAADLRNLQDQLADGLLSRQEYNLEARALAEERSRFEKEAQADAAGFVQRSVQNLYQVVGQELQAYLAQYAASKIAERLIAGKTEAQKTALAQQGVVARIALQGQEVLASLKSAAASMVDAVAKAIKAVASLPFPVNVIVGAASVGGITLLYKGAKSQLGFEEGGSPSQRVRDIRAGRGGHTGHGLRHRLGGVDEMAWHMGEFIYTERATKGQIREHYALMKLLEQGHRLRDILTAAMRAGAIGRPQMARQVLTLSRHRDLGRRTREMSGMTRRLYLAGGLVSDRSATASTQPVTDERGLVAVRTIGGQDASRIKRSIEGLGVELRRQTRSNYELAQRPSQLEAGDEASRRVLRSGERQERKRAGRRFTT